MTQRTDAIRELADRTLSRLLGVTTWVARSPDNGEDCLATAICKESNSDRVSVDFCGVIFDRTGGYDPIRWNDSPGRTFDDVVFLLESIVEDENLFVPSPPWPTKR
jgi:hypothetical protein